MGIAIPDVGGHSGVGRHWSIGMPAMPWEGSGSGHGLLQAARVAKRATATMVRRALRLS